MPSDKVSIAIGCVQHAINDTQDTIKAYDVKAEVLGLLLTLSVGITNFGFLQLSDAFSKSLMYASCLMSLIAILVLGVVLIPQRKRFEGIQFDGYIPAETYFLTGVLGSPQNTVKSLATKMADTDWLAELAYESMKLSIIRDHKHKWFLRGVWWSAATLILVSTVIARNIYVLK